MTNEQFKRKLLRNNFRKTIQKKWWKLADIVGNPFNKH